MKSSIKLSVKIEVFGIELSRTQGYFRTTSSRNRMIHFDYYTPTKVVFGEDAEKKAGKEIKAIGAKKVLIHYGGGSSIKSGLMDLICDSLDRSGIEYVS